MGFDPWDDATVSAAVRGPRQSERLGTDGAASYGAERLGSRSLKACAMKACAVTKQDGQVVGSILLVGASSHGPLPVSMGCDLNGAQLSLGSECERNRDSAALILSLR